jgi:hypothetical protein
MGRIAKVEYWLLNLVCDGSFPLYRLTHPDLELIANRDGHGLPHSELLEVLHQLFQEGSLVCVRHPDDETTIEFVPTYQDIDTALQGQDYVQYRLTPKGGEQWEILSHPDWNWFIGGGYGPNKNEAFIETKSYPVAEQYLQMFPYLFSAEVIHDSITYKILRPWQATYWKKLPEGCELYVKTKDTQIKLQRDMSSQEREFINHVRNWYTDPFK